jgi:RNA polymerase primary sigma factor
MRDPAQKRVHRGWRQEEEMQQYPEHRLLSRAEERALGEQLAGGSAAARQSAKEALIQHNLRLVSAIARRFQNQGLEWEELVQEGVIGLAEAVDRWDPKRGLKFSTYATFWVRQQMGRALQKTGEMIRRPAHAYEQWGRIERRRRALADEWGREPTLCELAEEVGVPEEELQAIAPIFVGSLDEPQRGEADSEPPPIAGPDRVEDEAVEHVAKERSRTLLHERLLSKLPLRERRVILRRMAGETLQAIANDLKLSREGVRHVQNRALRVLRRAAEGLSAGEREELLGGV